MNPGEERMTIAAARRWKGKIAQGQKGAFSTWNVLLVLDKTRTEGFVRVLKAGGASVSIPDDNNPLSVRLFLLKTLISIRISRTV